MKRLLLLTLGIISVCAFASAGICAEVLRPGQVDFGNLAPSSGGSDFVEVTEAERQAVFVNVVGNIKPEQLALLGEKLHIDPLKKIGKATHKDEDGERKEQAEETEKQ